MANAIREAPDDLAQASSLTHHRNNIQQRRELSITASCFLAGQEREGGDRRTVHWDNGGILMVSRAAAIKVRPPFALSRSAPGAAQVENRGEQLPKLLDAPFWLDPSDPHRMRSATAFNPAGVCNHLLFRAIGGTAKLIRRRFGKAAYRVAAAGISSEQAVDEAIACIKQILNK